MRPLCTLFGALAVMASAGAALGEERIYSITLNGANEAPANASPATGTGTVTIDLDLLTMRVQTSFSGLLGNVTVAHIHGPTLDPGAGIAGVMTVTPSFVNFPAGVTAGSYDHTYDLTLASSFNPNFVNSQGGLVNARSTMLAAMSDGKAYLNIHTTAFGGGEIRGFLVPEPTTATLLVGAALATLRRRR
jgi:CHRD domain